MGSGVEKTETRDVADFRAITFGGRGELEIKIGQPQSLTLTGDDNLLPLIRTDVRDGRLIIGTDRGVKLYPTRRLLIAITVDDVTDLSFNGEAKADITRVANDRLSIVVRGSGQVTASGKTTSLNVEAFGKTAVQTQSLAARDVRVQIAGEGNAQVQASKTLDVLITGTGKVRYRGDAMVNRIQITGAGSVVKAN